MKIFTSAWDARTGHIDRVRLTDSVLDQMLHGSSEVQSEILSLLDQEVSVEASIPDLGTDLGRLRLAITETLELSVRADEAGTARAALRTALWSFGGSLEQRVELAEAATADLYEPEIIMRTSTPELTAHQALLNGRAVGAIGRTQEVRLLNPDAFLDGISHGGRRGGADAP